MIRLIPLLFLLVFSTSMNFAQSTEDWETGNFSNHAWYFSGNADWKIVQSPDPVHGGTYAIRSGAITHNEKTSINLKINVTTAGTVSFYYRAETESCCDYLSFYVDGSSTGNSYTENEWTLVEHELTTGIHTLSWKYSKDGSVSTGADAIWIDDIALPEYSAPNPGTTAAYTALNSLFSETNGTQWTNNKYWGTNSPLYTWKGVDINTAGEPTQIELGNNNLDGLTDLSELTELTYLNVAHNNLDFGDLEAANISLSAFNYSPQKRIPITESILGNEITLAANTSGNGLTYQWFKNGSEIQGATNNTITLLDSEKGSYYCNINHPTFTELTLQTEEYGIGYQNGVTQEEYDALVALYYITDGTNWTNNTNWLSNDPVSNWHGVTVSGENVTGLNLSYNSLSGSIPKEIENLINLNYLRLNDNMISGAIPAELEKLTELLNLDLSRNRLTGAIPAEIGKITSLTTINLSYNQLTGAIPKEIENLTSLTSLSLANNQLSGAIPTGISYLTNLTRLELSENQLTGEIHEITALTNLNSLYISDNKLSGVIPNEIGNLTNLQSLYLNRNEFTGSIPAGIGNLENLYSLNLSQNQLTGEIPTEIGNLTNLGYLYLDYNQLSSTTLSSITSLTNLYEFRINNNQLSGSIPTEIGNLTKLKRINLSYNKLEGTIPTEFGNLTNVENINLKNNLLSGTIPTEIGTLTSLRYLYLNNNNFTSIPDLSSTALYRLEIQNNSFDFSDIGAANVSPNYFFYTAQKELEVTKGISGSEVTFSITIDGSNNSFQWFKDGTEITDATASSLTVQDSETGIYHCQVTDSNWPDLTLKSFQMAIGHEFEQLSHGVAIQDYNALVSFYHATNGNLWEDRHFNNWLSSYDANRWYGITVENYRVTKIRRNNEKLSGSLPTEMSELTLLNYLDVRDNDIENIEDLSGLTNLNTVHIYNNKLDFGDIETANLSVANTYNYSSQKRIPIIETNDAGEVTLSVSVDGTGNTYQWYKDDVIIDGATSSSYSFNEGENGIYFCEISNPNFSELTLESKAINIGINLNHGVLEQEYLALVALFEATGGESWFGKDDWLSSSNVDKWYGIIVKNFHVTEIHLSSNNLTNSLPNEMNNLNKLEVLDLSYNQLNGLTDLSGLINVKNVYVRNNELTFHDLESTTLSASLLSYSAQKNSSVSTSIQGDNTIIESSTPSTNNQYQWYKDDVAINGATSNSITIANSDAGSYHCMVYNDNYTSLTLQSKSIVIGTNMINGVVEQDYNALVDLYNSTNGSAWNNNKGWLSDIDVSEWYGITVNRARVVNIGLSNNNLNGELQETLGNLDKIGSIDMSYNSIKGQLPTSFSNFSNPYLYFNNNSISDLPDYSSSNINYLNVARNDLQFDDLEPNSTLNIEYPDQATVGLPETLSPNVGERVELSANVGGTNNTYQWYKDGAAINGATAVNYVIENYQEADAGEYSCEISNTVITDLSIETAIVYINTSAPQYSVNLYTSGGGSLSGNGNYNVGSEVTITATPSPGFVFLGWKYYYSNSNIISTDATYSFIIAYNVTYQAVFEYKPYPEYDINITTNGNGSVTGAGTYDEGTEVTLTATADANNEFVNWTEGGEALSTDATINFTASENRDITANFIPLYSVTTTASPSAGGTVTGAETYPEGKSVTVTATANAGYRFVEWQENGTTVHNSSEYSFDISENRDLTAIFEALPTYTIAASTSLANAATITGDGTYYEGDEVSLSATKNIGFRFINWTEAGSEVATSESYAFTAMADRSLVANYEPVAIHSAVLTASPANGGQLSGEGYYEEGDEVTISATAATGYVFVNWTKKSDASTVSSNASYTYTINATEEFVANFRELPSYEISATANPTNGGQITGAGKHYLSNNVTLKATPNAGYQFVNWTENGTEVATSESYTFDCSADRALVANFATAKVSLTVTATPTEAGQSSTEEFAYGAEVKLTASPTTGYQFVAWKKNGSVVSQDASYTFTITENTDLVAEYEKIKFNITTSVAPDPAGTVTGAGSYATDESATVEATPAKGYVFVAWKENGAAVSETAQYTFSVSGNRDLTAEFRKAEYPVTVTASPEDAGTVTGAGTFEFADNAKVTATAKDGYQFVSWAKGDAVVSTNAEYSFDVTENVALVANFEKIDVTVSVEYDASQATVAGAGTFKFGDNVALKATPSEGYQFDGWVENGDVISTEASLSFDATANRTLSLKLTKLFTIALTVAPTEGGTAEGNGTYAEGAEVTVKATAKNGYEFMNWTIGGTEVSKDANYTFTATKDAELVANFSKPTGVFEAKELAVKAYPNPATDYLLVELSEVTARDMKIYLTSVNGRRSNVEIVQGSKNIKVDLAGLGTGQYILQIVSKGKLLATKKIQIQ